MLSNKDIFLLLHLTPNFQGNHLLVDFFLRLHNNPPITHTASVEAFNKELAKQLLKPMDAVDLKDPEKASAIWIKNLNSAVNKMNNTKSSIIDMKPKDAIKMDISELYKSETYRGKQTT